MNDDHAPRATVLDDDLPSLRDDTAPRRTDTAFSRAVADDVARRRRFALLGPLLAPLAVGAGIFAFVFARAPAPHTTVPARADIASVVVAEPGSAGVRLIDEDDDHEDNGVIDVDDLDDDTLLALSGSARSERDHFAFEGLEGSTDHELDDVERAFDAALAKKL
jgi:hypothetical protein